MGRFISFRAFVQRVSNDIQDDACLLPGEVYRRLAYNLLHDLRCVLGDLHQAVRRDVIPVLFHVCVLLNKKSSVHIQTDDFVLFGCILHSVPNDLYDVLGSLSAWLVNSAPVLANGAVVNSHHSADLPAGKSIAESTVQNLHKFSLKLFSASLNIWDGESGLLQEAQHVGHPLIATAAHDGCGFQIVIRCEATLFTAGSTSTR